jgi:hypothetical protein
VGYVPALVSLPRISTKENNIYLDFQNCSSIDSSGLNLLLMQVLKLIVNDGIRRTWHCTDSSQIKAFQALSDLNFFSILNSYSVNSSLFDYDFPKQIKQDPTFIMINDVRCFPIYVIDFPSFSSRRNALDPLKEWLYQLLLPYYKQYDFILPQFVSVINEIAKNSADHTSNKGFVGIEIRNCNDDEIKISFSIGDLGIGIHQNIKNHLSPELSKRFKFWDLTQTYREALNSGFTTREFSKENKGLGMSLILDGAKGLQLSLSVFDANSRGILDNIDSIAHAEIRRNFFNIRRDVGFYYYGELKAKKYE